MSPWILIRIGTLADRNTSDALRSAISRRTFSILPLMLVLPVVRCWSRPEQVVQAGLGPGLRVDLLDDHGAVQAVPAVGLGQVAGDDHRARGHPAVADFVALAVVDRRALADIHPHPEDRVLLDDHAFDDLGACADEAVVLDDRRVGLEWLEHAADADAARQVHVLAD